MIKIKRFCKNCNKEFQIGLYRLSQGRGIFCSRKCRNLYPISNETRQRLSRWQRGRKLPEETKCGYKLLRIPEEDFSNGNFKKGIGTLN